MKKILALFLTLITVFTFAACGGSGNTPDNTDKHGTSQSDNKKDGIDWEAELYLTNVTVPEGSTAKKVFYNKIAFVKDGGYTSDEKKECLQMLWNACLEISKHGIYSLDTSTDTITETYSSLDKKLENTYDWESDYTSWYFTNKNGFWVYLDVYMGIDGEINVSAMAGKQIKQ